MSSQSLHNFHNIILVKEEIDFQGDNEINCNNDTNKKLITLQKTYHILSKEKEKQEQEFSKRTDIQLKLIDNYQKEIESLKEKLHLQKSQLKDIEASINAQRELSENKYLNNEKLKKELENVRERYNKLKEEDILMESQIKCQMEEKTFLRNQINALKQKIEEVLQKNQELIDSLKQNEIETYYFENMKADLQQQTDILITDNKKKSQLILELEGTFVQHIRMMESLENQRNSLLPHYDHIMSSKEREKQLESEKEIIKQLLKQSLEQNNLLKESSDQIKLQQSELAFLQDDLKISLETTNSEQISQFKDSQLHSLKLELQLRMDKLLEMEEKFNQADKRICKFQQQNNYMIRNYDWVKQELSNSNNRLIAEKQKNLELTNSNKELEECLKDKNYQIQLYQQKEYQLRKYCKDLVKMNQSQNREIEILQQQLINKVMKLQKNKQQVDNQNKKINSLKEILYERDGEFQEHNHKPEVKDNSSNHQQQSHDSLELFTGFEDEQKKLEFKNYLLVKELQDAKYQLSKIEGQFNNQNIQVKPPLNERVQMIREEEQKKELQEQNKLLIDIINQMRKDKELLIFKYEKMLENNNLLEQKMQFIEQQQIELQNRNLQLNEANYEMTLKIKQLTHNLDKFNKEQGPIQLRSQKKRAVTQDSTKQLHQPKLPLNNLKFIKAENSNSFSASQQYQRNNRKRNSLEIFSNPLSLYQSYASFQISHQK